MELQNILFPKSTYLQEAELYLRSDTLTSKSGDRLRIPPNGQACFDTYFNAFSIRKWSQYCALESLELRGTLLQGEVLVEIFSIHANGYINHERLSLSMWVNKIGVFCFDLSNLLKDDCEVIYLRLVAGAAGAELSKIAFNTQNAPRQDVSLAVCICTFNRESYVQKTVKTLTNGAMASGIDQHIVIANNGDPINVGDSPNVEVLKNRNLGGAGGFTRAMHHAKKNGASHILLMDDDIFFEFESVLRTYRFYQLVLPKFRTTMINGSMLSSEEPWLQYERHASIQNGRLQHHGSGQDLGERENVEENAMSPMIRGLAGWWFCAFDARILDDIGLPLPIFIRGDDVEFSLRADKDILNFNGICVWHDPFTNKYSELMEDYYLARNMTMIAFCSPVRRVELMHQFLWRKFKLNIRTLNYAAAEMNLLAARHVLNGNYREDPAELHLKVAAYLGELKNGAEFIPGKPALRRRASKTSKKTILTDLRFVAGVLRLWPTRKGHASYGFDRKIQDFAGRKTVYVYNPAQNKSEIVRLDRVRIIAMTREMSRLYRQLRAEHKRLRRELTAFRIEAAKEESWQNLWDA